MPDIKTKHLGLPLPHELHELQEDLPRLQESLQLIDTKAASQDAEITKIDTEVKITKNIAVEAKAQALEALGREALPEQTGQAGKMLTTDGAAASWTDVPATDWDSITGKPDNFVLREVDGTIAGDISGNATTATSATTAMVATTAKYA